MTSKKIVPTWPRLKRQFAPHSNSRHSHDMQANKQVVSIDLRGFVNRWSAVQIRHPAPVKNPTLYRQAPPAWLDDAVWALAVKRRTKAHAKRAREAAIRSMRYEAVRDAHHLDGLSWEEACVHATKVYADNPDVAAEPDRMWKAYKRVKKDLRKGRGGLYFTPKKQNRP